MSPHNAEFTTAGSLTDRELLEEGAVALRQRLGTLGYLRYLRLTRGGQDDFAEIRRAWENVGIDELLEATGATRVE